MPFLRSFSNICHIQMGNSPSYRRKGVTYKSDGSVVDCLFCRISREQEVNELWYRDGDEHPNGVAVFVTRTPAAFMHLLVVPTRHVGNLDDLNASHAPLLERMRSVAEAQIAAHAPRTSSPLGNRAPAPSYGYDRGSHFGGSVDPFSGVSAAATAVDEASAGFDRTQFRLAFHRPPYNSIDHLHLHALYGPWTRCWDSLTFAPGAPWHASFEEVASKVGLREHVAGSGSGPMTAQSAVGVGLGDAQSIARSSARSSASKDA